MQLGNGFAPAEDEDDEEFEFCDCGRDFNDCASQHGASVCMDVDDYEKYGEPKNDEEEDDDDA